jgi:hypothetical protein
MTWDTTTISNMGPMIAMESAKAQGLKTKPTKLSLPKLRDKATQRVASSWRTDLILKLHI